MRLRFFPTIGFFSVLISVVLILPCVVRAHGTGYRVLQQAKAITLEFYYSDGTAMAYAETLIFSPEEAALEYCNGRTDKNGRIAFSPDTPGTWRLDVSDGMGHKVKALVPLQTEQAKETTPRSASRGAYPQILFKTLSAVLGISLIFNLCLVVLLVRSKKAA